MGQLGIFSTDMKRKFHRLTDGVWDLFLHRAPDYGETDLVCCRVREPQL